MKYQSVYKCQRCGAIFAGESCEDYDGERYNRHLLHEHICDKNQHGFAEKIGFDVIENDNAPNNGVKPTAKGRGQVRAKRQA